MYEYFKTLLLAVETIANGDIQEFKLLPKTTYCGDRIEIEGTLPDGSPFELRFEKKEKPAAEITEE